MNVIMAILGAVIFLIAAPLLGGLLSGIDRIITARMQSRRGPPVLQPFYDISKQCSVSTLLGATSDFLIVEEYPYSYLVSYITFC